MIEASGLTIGDRLPTENELAVRLGVARSTIREAMKAWQYMGIVTRNKSAGTVLATKVCSNSVHVPLTLKPESESLLRTYSVRRPLEIEATRLVTINAGNADRKTILVHMIAGFEPISAGEPLIDGKRMSELPPHSRDIAMVSPGEGNISGQLEVVERLCSDSFIYVQVPKVERLLVRCIGNTGSKSDETVGLRFDPENAHLFDSQGNRLALNSVSLGA